MELSAHELLAGWQSFYVITGSVAGALIGLQFVVMALVANSRRRASMGEVSAFGTPTVLHFSAALFLAAVACAPWRTLDGLRLLLLVTGLAGTAYTLLVIRRAGQTPNYKAQLEDWIWHAVLPLLAYIALGIGAGFLLQYSTAALAVIASVTLLLVFIGIHNSWDTIIYVATNPEHETETDPRPDLPRQR